MSWQIIQKAIVKALALWREGLAIVGFGAVTVGAHQVYAPAGWIVGGAFAVLIAVASKAMADK